MLLGKQIVIVQTEVCNVTLTKSIVSHLDCVVCFKIVVVIGDKSVLEPGGHGLVSIPPSR